MNNKLLHETTGHISNENKAIREDAKNEFFSYKELTTSPPDWLPLSAKTEWKRIVPLLKEEMTISEMDFGLLISYCICFARIKTAEENITKYGNYITKTGNTGVKNKVENPAIKIQSQAMKDLKAISTSLAITPQARQSLSLNKAKEKEPSDPFAMLMNDE